MDLVHKTQGGLLSDPTPFVEYLTLELKQDKYEAEQVSAIIDEFSKIAKSIGQKDTTAMMTVTIGFSFKGWTSLFPKEPIPAELHPFIELRSADRHFPSSPGDIFLMVKSMRIDLNYQASKYILSTFKPIANAIQDIQCDAVNMEALKAYEKNLSDDKIKDAYNCLYERCLVSSEQ